MTGPIEKRVLLPCPPERAFVLFTEHASDWWPLDRRHTQDPRSQIRMTPGGRFWERATDGAEVELGSVTAWEPPERLVLDFFVGTDAEHPTEVVITFTPAADNARATLVLVRHGPKPASAELYEKRAPAYERSWTLLLDALRDAASAPA